MLEQLGEEQLRLLGLLARTAAALPSQGLVEPSDERFPDYQPDLVVAGKLIHSLMADAGLGDWELEIVDGREPNRRWLRIEELEVEHPDISFLEAEGKKLLFQITRLGPADMTLAAMAQEVARAALSVSSQGGGAHPYRSGPAPSADAEDDALVAAATVWLGFGLITLPAAISFRRSSVATGYSVTTRQTIMQTSALPSGDLAFLLGACMVIREDDDSEMLCEYLVKEQAENVAEWITALERDRPALLAKLGLPETLPPRREPPAVKPLDVRKLERMEKRLGKDNIGKTLKRQWERRTLSYALIGFCIALVPSVILAQWVGGFVLLLVIVGFFIGMTRGSSKRRYFCGGCELPLRDDESQCPRCGASFEGECELVRVTRTIDDLDDDEDEELTREALACYDDED